MFNDPVVLFLFLEFYFVIRKINTFYQRILIAIWILYENEHDCQIDIK